MNLWVCYVGGVDIDVVVVVIVVEVWETRWHLIAIPLFKVGILGHLIPLKISKRSSNLLEKWTWASRWRRLSCWKKCLKLQACCKRRPPPFAAKDIKLFPKNNLCHSLPKGLLPKGLLPKGLLPKGLLPKGLLLEKCLNDIQTFSKRKPVPFAAEGPPSEEMFERYLNFFQKKTCVICCWRASRQRASCRRASF